MLSSVLLQVQGGRVAETAVFGECGSEVKLAFQKPTHIFVIAEIGINHNGSLTTAKSLIDMAVRAGCDAVKFQKRTVDIVYSPDVLAAPRESPWGFTQRDQKDGLEFGEDEYREIDLYCRTQKILWTASAWDSPSLDFIEAFKPAFHKVASAMITNTDFLRHVASLGRPTVLSTGMSSLEDVDRAVEIFQEVKTPVCLLHTVSTYPSIEEDLNLLTIQTFRDRYGLPVGYSGHEPSVSPSIVAAALGASVIERHITLDRSMYGSDQAASLEEAGLRQLVGSVRKLPLVLGDGVKRWAPGESEVAKKLRYWE